MAEFFAMGGYAFYVWSAFGLVVAVLLGNAVVPWWRHRRLQRERRKAAADSRQAN